jgi:actin-related protein 6
MPIVVLDNGAGTLRGGWAGDPAPRRSMPNCIARVRTQNVLLAGDETVDAIRDKSQLTFQRPHDRGYLINWETQLDVWQRMFSPAHLNVASPQDHSLLFTEPPFAPAMLSETANEVSFKASLATRLSSAR